MDRRGIGNERGRYAGRPGWVGSCRAGGRPEAARRAGLEDVEKSLPAPSTARTRWSGTRGMLRLRPALWHRWSSWLAVLAPRRPGRGRRRPREARPRLVDRDLDRVSGLPPERSGVSATSTGRYTLYSS